MSSLSRPTSGRSSQSARVPSMDSSKLFPSPCPRASEGPGHSPLISSSFSFGGVASAVHCWDTNIPFSHSLTARWAHRKFFRDDAMGGLSISGGAAHGQPTPALKQCNSAHASAVIGCCTLDRKALPYF
eukprot:RCo049796